MGWPIINQNPNVAPPRIKALAEATVLPHLIRLWKAVEAETGYRWKCTSYWRDSPSHKWGMSLDIAPDIAKSSEHLYAVSSMSDPVLYKRVPLMRALQRVSRSFDPIDQSYGLFVEPDHIHMQVLKPDPDPEVYVVKWKIAKPIYTDTEQRMELPLTTTGYL